MVCNVETQELFPLAEQDLQQNRKQQEYKPQNLAEFMERFYPDQKACMKPRVSQKTRIDPDLIGDEEDHYGEE